MYHREFPLTPTQQAVTGSLDIYVEGRQKDSAKQMLFGLSILREATEAQIQVAIKSVQLSRHLTASDIAGIFAATDGAVKALPATSAADSDSAATSEADSWRALSSPVRNDVPVAAIV